MKLDSLGLVAEVVGIGLDILFFSFLSEPCFPLSLCLEYCSALGLGLRMPHCFKWIKV